MAALPESALINDSALSDDVYCLARNASYLTRVDNPDAYDWCIVPNSSYDVVLFAGLSVVLASLVNGKHATLVILLAGGALMGLAWGVNLGQLGNSIAWWLGISPWQLFFYVFLPPLLLDAAVKIDWFIFKKIVVQVVTLAFLVVGLSCAVMIPIMLYMLNLRADGWNWAHACMFGAMVASTDAVAIVAVMKTGGGPKQLRSLLEGESLLNDASGLTLFEIFFHYVIEYADPIHLPGDTGVGHILAEVVIKVIQFAGIGFVMGMAFGVTTRVLLRFMRRMGAGRDQEVALTVAMAYLAYYITAALCHGSGVVAVAVMGLYGAATGHWDMSTSAHEEGTFDGFWDTLAFIVNAIVFLYSGASCVNFFVRSSTDLLASNQSDAFAKTLWMVPIIYIILSLLRFALIALFRPLFIASKGDLSFKEAAFVAVAGLRGSVSLIMGQAVVTERALSGEIPVVKAQIIFWTAGFVLLTLLVNAPLLPRVLRWLSLNRIPDKQLRRRQRAIEALGEHTQEIIEELRDDEDELLSGVDWAQVERFVDMSKRLSGFALGHNKPRKHKLGVLMAFCRRCCGRRKAKGNAKGLGDANSSSMGRGAFGGSGQFGGSGNNGGSDSGYRKSSMAAYFGPGSEPQAGLKDLEEAGGGAELQRLSSDSDASDASNVLHDVLGTWFQDMEDIDVLHQEVPFLLKQQTRPQDLEDHQRHAQQVIQKLQSQAAGDGPTAQGASAALAAVNTAATKAADALAKQDAADDTPEEAEAARPKLQLLASLATNSQSKDSQATEGIQAGGTAATHSSTTASSSTDAAAASDDHTLRTTSASSSGQASVPFASTSDHVPSSVFMPPLPSLVAPSCEAMQPPDTTAQAAQPGNLPVSPLQTISRNSAGSTTGNIASTSHVLGPASGTSLLSRISPLHLLKKSPAPAPSTTSAPPALRSLATRSAGMYSSYADQAQQHGHEMQAIGVSKARVYKNLARSSHLGDGGTDGGAGPAAPVGAALGRRSVNLGRGSVGLGGSGSGSGSGSGRHRRNGSSGDVDMEAVAEGGHRRHGSGLRDDHLSPGADASNAAGSSRRLGSASVPRSLATRSQAAYLVPRMQDLGRLSHHPEHPHTPNSARSMHSNHSLFAPRRDDKDDTTHASHRALGTRSMPAPYHALSVAGPAAGAGLSGGGSQQPGRKSRPLGAMSSLQSHSEEAKEQELQADELADARAWLVSGLKRYFHGKRMAGLLSARGLRILDFACDTLLDDPYKPLSLWSNIQKDAVNNLVVRGINGSLFATTPPSTALCWRSRRLDCAHHRDAVNNLVVRGITGSLFATTPPSTTLC